jgi:hypothetical protein
MPTIQKRVFIIHGYGAKSSDNWFPWLQTELEKKGFETAVPQMTDTEEPTLQKWLPHLQYIVGKCDENTYFVGHSLGTITILKYLESLPEGEKSGGIVLVGGFSESIESEKLSSFTEKPLDYEKVKKSVREIIAIHSTDDKMVPFKFAEIMREKLGAKLIILHDAGHINRKSGYIQLPQALESILKMSSVS